MTDTSNEITSLGQLLSPDQVRAQVASPDWRDAVSKAGALLVNSGACTEGYIAAMQDAVRDIGPYIVVAPGIAMPHARPESGVLEPAVSVITLAEPVEFGHKANDPVDLVISFAAVDKNAHLQTLQQIVAVLQDPPLITRLRAASTDNELYKALLPQASTIEGK